MEKKCAYCGKRITREHVMATIDRVKYIFCYQKRVIGTETCLDKFLIKNPVKYSYNEETVK